MSQLHFGDVRGDRLIEEEGLGFDPNFFFPDSTEEGWAEERDWLVPNFLDRETGRMIRAIQSYVIRTDHHVILVDACVGNDKERPSTPNWTHMQTPWLANMAALGVAPEEVDFVLCTHLHADHVGWNTRLVDGRWVPTFPNAKYLFHRDEYTYWENNIDEVEGPGSADGCFEDSVLPVMEAGQAELVGGDYQIDDRLHLAPTPGHLPGHVVLNLEAGGERAVFCGDVIHHAVQCARPEWNSRFCWNAEMSSATRRKFVESHADTGTLILPGHFPTPTAGRIVAHGQRCRFEF